MAAWSRKAAEQSTKARKHADEPRKQVEKRRNFADEGDFSAAGAANVNNLFSNFTYFLDDPENGDQFEQADRRLAAGGRVT